jgi:heat shock protein HslJ
MTKKVVFVGILALVVAAAFFIADMEKTKAPEVATTETPTSQDDSPAPGAGSVDGTSWEWVQTANADGTVTKPADSSKFVLTFSGDVFSSTTDCNSMRGALAVDGEVLSMGQIASTKMFCEGSLEGEYAQDLQLVGSHQISGDTLTLIQLKDAGTMTFAKI